MIQDDPINQKSTNMLNNLSNEYFPLSNESEEDIVAFKGIEIASETIKVSGTSPNNDKRVYYKFAMLIGLCKNHHILNIIFIIYNLFLN